MGLDAHLVAAAFGGRGQALPRIAAGVAASGEALTRSEEMPDPSGWRAPLGAYRNVRRSCSSGLPKADGHQRSLVGSIGTHAVGIDVDISAPCCRSRTARCSPT